MAQAFLGSLIEGKVVYYRDEGRECARACGGNDMAKDAAANGAFTIAARLDRLPISSFHRRIMWLIGIGMFFDGFDIYVAATVLGAMLKSGFSTMGQNAQFVSVTFIGMMLGSFLTGFLGDRYGRRFSYQANLAIFGLASLAAAFAPSIGVLILLRFIMGVGLGAENVVGYSTMTEFIPPRVRGKWLGGMSVFVVSGLPITALIAWSFFRKAMKIRIPPAQVDRN